MHKIINFLSNSLFYWGLFTGVGYSIHVIVIGGNKLLQSSSCEIVMWGLPHNLLLHTAIWAVLTAALIKDNRNKSVEKILDWAIWISAAIAVILFAIVILIDLC
jgi:hypothetical protein